ncbi:DUF6010 family protein [Mucilaginibacter flavidus]|uniref:DUF6010 family protein n=1 Tax=Mucilaginibacter flavidus TaxID=2949309 RepID=UPI002093BE8C|nr:DUF6010 family protein [Mucilaginibacter flavidus]MCO5945750.1 hypothetical protein [Mucilaginibacter flavidus]
MTAIIIGVGSGILTILIIALLRFLDKQTFYGLILTGIGYLYVGFTWRDTGSLVLCAGQAILFSLIAYYGVKKSMLLLAAGYFLHGLWDLAFDLFPYTKLIPPHYDLFCLSIDFTMGFYLIVLNYRNAKSAPLE